MKRGKRFVTTILGFICAISMMLSCGVFKNEKSSTAGVPVSDPPQKSSKDTDNPKAGEGDDVVMFLGYVVNAFEVTVDDKIYGDMEEFYTEELKSLPAKVAVAGYDESYDVQFDAEIGFQDLWRDMTVYIAPVNNRGYQGQTKVGRDGKFQLSLPKQALDEEYRLRANKRITVNITKENERNTICYNFSAVEKSALFTEEEKPIVLDQFTTKVTAYDCAVDEEDGLSIPDMVDENSDKVLLKPGMSKEDVLSAIGRNYITIKNGTKWCWNPPTDGDRICSVQYYSDCRCSVNFDDNGLLISQENLRSDLLDILSW